MKRKGKERGKKRSNEKEMKTMEEEIKGKELEMRNNWHGKEDKGRERREV